MYTVDENDTLNPIDYSITEENAAQIVSFNIVSEYSKPLPGDILITLADASPLIQKPGFLGTSLPMEYGYGITAIIVGVLVTVTVLYLRRKK